MPASAAGMSSPCATAAALAALCVPGAAFAADGTLTLNAGDGSTLAGHSFTVYKLANYNDVVKDGANVKSVSASSPDAAADADYIVTYNLKDFPLEKLSRYSITAIHPDVFLCRMLDRDTRGMLDVMDTVVSNKTNPPRTMGEEMAHLRKLRLNTFSDRLKSLYSE